MTKRALAALLACLAIAAIAAGCGGSSDSTSSGGSETTSSAGGETSSGGGETSSDSGESSSAPSKAVFIKEADKICKVADDAMQAELGDFADEHGISTAVDPTEAQQVALYKEVVLPNVGRQGKEIAKLTPPEGEEDTIREIVDAIERGVEEGEAHTQPLTEGHNPFVDASEKAIAYGMKVCGADEN